METINTLKKLIKPNSIIPVELGLYDKYFCKLKEPEFDYALEIKNTPSDMLVIKCDNFPETTKFFKSDHNECKRADYILLSSSEKTVMIIELKHSNNSTPKKDIIDQLKGAKCVLDYCKSISKSFLGSRDFLLNYTFRYYIYYNSIVQKSSFKHKKLKTENKTPEEARIIKGKTIYFKELLM